MLSRRKTPRSARRFAVTGREVGLRLRERWLRRTLPKQQGPLLSYARALLAGVFEAPALRGDAPGVPGLRRGEGFARCARALGLPVPVTVQRGRTLVAALLVAPRGDSLDFYVLPESGFGRVQVEKVKERVRRVSAFVEGRALKARFHVIDAPTDPRPWLTVACSGALLAGAAPADFWSLAEAQARALTAAGLLELARGLPTPLCQWLATLALGKSLAPAPFLEPTLGAAAFADVERFCAAWVRPEHQRLAQQLLITAGSAPQPAPWPAPRHAHLEAAHTAPTQEIPVVSFEAVLALSMPAGQGAAAEAPSPWPGLAAVQRAAAPAKAQAIAEAPLAGAQQATDSTPWPGLAQLTALRTDGAPAKPTLRALSGEGATVELPRPATAQGPRRPDPSGVTAQRAGSPAESDRARLAAELAQRANASAMPTNAGWDREDEASPWPGLEALARAQVAGAVAAAPLDLGRLLVAAAWRSLRQVPLAERAGWRALLDSLGCGRAVPQPLRARVVAALEGRALLSLPAPRRVGALFQVTDPQAGSWARGGSPERALAAAIAAIASCGLGSAERFVEDPAWKRLAPRLAAAAPKRVCLALVGEGSILLASLRPGRKPNVQSLSRDAGLRRVLVELERGRGVELIALSPAVAHDVTLWSRAVSTAPRFAGQGRPLAIAQSGRLISAFEGRATSHRLAFALWRPRRLSFLTGSAFDERHRPAQVAALETLRCAIGVEGEDAVLHYRDAQGDELQERVPLVHLRSHLADAEALLMALPRRAVLQVQASPALAQREASLILFTGPTVAAQLEGAMPFGLQVRVGGALFGARARFGWSDAALTVLSHWQVGVVGRISISNVSLSVRGGHASALLALYARSVALRRLAVRIAPRVGLKPPRKRVELSLAR